MKNKFYRIRGVCPGLDGLVVELVTDSVLDTYVHRIYNTNQIIGDRCVAVEVPAFSLKIGETFLEKAEDPTTRQYAHDNPYGKLIGESKTILSDGVTAFYLARYENAVQFGLAANGKVLHSDSLFESRDLVEGIYNNFGIYSVDEIVFKLKDLKEKESNGKA